jgi:hypothetical protein
MLVRVPTSPRSRPPSSVFSASRADSFGRTQQDDWRAIARAESKRGGEGWSQRTQKLEITELNTLSEHPRRATFYVAFGIFVGI